MIHTEELIHFVSGVTKDSLYKYMYKLVVWALLLPEMLLITD